MHELIRDGHVTWRIVQVIYKEVLKQQVYIYHTRTGYMHTHTHTHTHLAHMHTYIVPQLNWLYVPMSHLPPAGQRQAGVFGMENILMGYSML